MRTTLNIADDVLLAAREAARRQNRSLGAVISDLARRSLVVQSAPSRRSTLRPRLARMGVQPLPQRGGLVDNETINRIESCC